MYINSSVDSLTEGPSQSSIFPTRRHIDCCLTIYNCRSLDGKTDSWT